MQIFFFFLVLVVRLLHNCRIVVVDNLGPIYEQSSSATCLLLHHQWIVADHFLALVLFKHFEEIFGALLVHELLREYFLLFIVLFFGFIIVFVVVGYVVVLGSVSELRVVVLSVSRSPFGFYFLSHFYFSFS